MKERYEIKARIGIGGHGVIYEAFDQQMRRKVAIKRINTAGGAASEGEKSFQRETETLASLNHPNIIKIYDADQDGEGFYLVMELLTGQTLMDFVRQNSPIKLKDFHEFAVQALDALTAAKQVNVLHRDIKATNFFLERTAAGRLHVILLDFGLAKIAVKEDTQTRSVDDTVMGSVHFMAPEQFEMLPLDHRTDLYSFGVCCYFMLTGMYPFDGDSAPLIMAAHLQHRVVPLNQRRPDLPPGLAAWVHKLISRKPEDRPESSFAALEELLALEMFEISAETATLSQAKEALRDEPQKEGSLGSKGSASFLTAVAFAAILGGVGYYLLNYQWSEGLPFRKVPIESGEKQTPQDTASELEVMPVQPPAPTEPPVKAVPASTEFPLPPLEAWEQKITEPGAEVDLVADADLAQGTGSLVRLVDGIGDNGFPKLETTLELPAVDTLEVRFDFRLAVLNAGGKLVEESWAFQLGPSDSDARPPVSAILSPEKLEIECDGENSTHALLPGAWYRVTLEWDALNQMLNGKLEGLEGQSPPASWTNLRLANSAAVIECIRIRDQSEKSFQPNNTLEVANLEMKIAPR